MPRRPTRSQQALDAALVAAVDALRSTIARRRRTWKGDAEALREVIETLSEARANAPVDTAAIGFNLETDPDYFDEDSEHPDHGMTEDHDHESLPVRGK